MVVFLSIVIREIVVQLPVFYVPEGTGVRLGNKCVSECVARFLTAPLASLVALNKSFTRTIQGRAHSLAVIWGDTANCGLVWTPCQAESRQHLSFLHFLYTQSRALALEMELWTCRVHHPYSDMAIRKMVLFRWVAMNPVNMAMKKNHPSLLYGIVTGAVLSGFVLYAFILS